MNVRRELFVVVFVGVVFAAVAIGGASAQRPNLEPSTPGQKPEPVVTFELSFPGAAPAHYAVAVESSGRAAYRSDSVGPQGTSSVETGEPTIEKFVVSDATRTRIFELARQVNYFNGNFDYTKRRIASTGIKTLRYSEGPASSFGHLTTGVRNETTYNWSENQAIQQLTDIFEGISSTLELGQRLAYLHRFDKLGLDGELKRAVELAQDGRLVELQAISPILRDLANDSAVLHIARQRAKKLLETSAAPAAASARP